MPDRAPNPPGDAARRRPSVGAATRTLIAVTVVAAVTITAATLVSSQRHREASADAEAAIQRSALYQDALGAASDEWVAVVGYFTQQDQEFVNRFARSNAQVNASLGELRAQAEGDPALAADLDRLTATHAGFAETDAAIIDAIGKQDLGRALELSTESDLFVQSDAFLQELQRRLVDQRAQLRVAQADQREASAAARVWSFGAVAVCALLMLLVAVAAFSWFGRPLDRARRATRSIASGDLSVRVPGGGPAELAGLGADVNAMAEALIRRSDELNAYLSKNLETRTAELERTNARLALEVEQHRQSEEALARALETERELEEQLRHQAFHDSLTSLANRARFTDRLEHALERTRRSAERVAVLFMDLDDFKSVNDSLGHPVGDMLLVSVAQRLSAAARSGDTVARLGGDEFAVLAEGLKDGEVESIGQRFIEAFTTPFSLPEREVYARVSIGIAQGEGGSATSDELLRRADVAMYMAKSEGKSRYAVYDAAMDSAIVGRLQLAADLQSALAAEQLEIDYQPMFELGTNAIVGVEALLRWRHPARGLIGPTEFIPLAEETGAITTIGQWTLRQACAQVRKWQLLSPDRPPMLLSVNVSAREIHQGSFVDSVRQIVSESGLPPETLVLEITESVVMRDAEAAIARLAELKEVGIRLALDDFGTGYSSLSYLRRFPVDILKIDKSFIDGVREQGKERELAQSIIELGQTLDLQLVAEGIEHSEQIGWLRSQQCQLGQGFIFSEPLPPDAIEELLRDQPGTSDASKPAA